MSIEQGTSSAVLYVENQNTYEITVTLDAALTNMTSDAVLPLTMSVDGNKTAKAFSVSAADPAIAWNYTYTFHWTPGSTNAAHDDSYIYSLPYKSWATHTVIQGYNGAFSHSRDFQYAIDFGMPQGTKVLCAREGRVVGVRDNLTKTGTAAEYKDLANYVMIKHSDGTIASYDHIKAKSAKVRVGRQVKAGDLLALSGNVGFCN